MRFPLHVMQHDSRISFLCQYLEPQSGEDNAAVEDRAAATTNSVSDADEQQDAFEDAASSLSEAGDEPPRKEEEEYVANFEEEGTCLGKQRVIPGNEEPSKTDEGDDEEVLTDVFEEENANPQDDDNAQKDDFPLHSDYEDEEGLPNNDGGLVDGLETENVENRTENHQEDDLSSNAKRNTEEFKPNEGFTDEGVYNPRVWALL